ncbi:MAG: TonB-dependent receptor [Chromatiales bacterium]|nr:TonB-dependent receptor [Chromatiales bacterium]
MDASSHTARRRGLVLGAAIAAAIAMPDPALAQIEEIVVTVRQRAETIRDVPGAVTVLGTGQIEASGIQRADDFIRLTPGVTLVNAAEVADTQVNIRGINGARDAETSFALVIDGILMTNPAALNREYTNLQQIEILKGPQGAIYGRNAAAGAIVITTQEPGDVLSGNLKASIAQDNSYLIAGHIGGPVNDTLRWGLTADWRQTDGFYRNVFLDRKVVDNYEGWNIGGRLIWEPTADLRVDTKIRYGEVDAASIGFNSVFHLPDLVGLLRDGFGLPNAFAQTAYQNVNSHNFQFNPNVVPFNNQESFEFSVKADYDLGFATLTSWVLYSDIENDLGADGTSAAFQFFGGTQACIDSTTAVALSGFQLAPPQLLIPGDPANSVYGAYTPTTCDGTQYQVRNQRDISFEARLNSNDDGGPFNWSAGVYYLNIDREVGVNTGVDTGDGRIIPRLFVPYATPGSLTSADVNPTEQLLWDQFDTDVWAIFGSVGYDFTDTVSGSLALRYDSERRKVRSKVPADAQTVFIQTCPDPGTQGSPLNPGLCDGPIANQSRTFSQIQPKGSLTWDFLPDWTAFATIGVGFKSGGFNNSGSSATVENFINAPLTNPGSPFDSFSSVNIPDQFDKETSLAYEIGVKAELLDRRLRGEVSLFRTEVDDMQFFEFIVGPFGLLRVVSNVDEVVIQGIEASANWAFNEWLDLYAGVSILDSEIKKNSARPDTVGNKSPYTANWTSSAGARIDVPLAAAPQFRVIGSMDVSTIGDTYFHVVQDQERPTGFSAAFGIGPAEYSVARRDAFTLVNARLGIAGDQWSVVGFATNLFNTRYLEEVITAPEFGGSFIFPGGERRFGVEANYRF